MHDFPHLLTVAIILVVIVLNCLLNTAGSTRVSSFLLKALLNPGTVCLPPFKILVEF